MHFLWARFKFKEVFLDQQGIRKEKNGELFASPQTNQQPTTYVTDFLSIRNREKENFSFFLWIVKLFQVKLICSFM